MENTIVNKTEQDLIQEAWDVQNACNLSGVVHSYSRALSMLREIRPMSTKDINEHIISKLYASKIQSLTGDLPLDLSGYGIKF